MRSAKKNEKNETNIPFVEFPFMFSEYICGLGELNKEGNKNH